MDTVLLINQIEVLYSKWGNIIIFLSSFIETLPLGFLIPGGVIVALGGFYSYGNRLDLVQVVLSATLGMIAAFILGYFVGKKTGYFLIKKYKQEKNAEIAKVLLKNHGPVILTTALLANLTRFWVSYLSGVERYSFPRFLFYSVVAALSWNSFLVFVGYLTGSERDKLEQGIAGLGVLSWGLVILASGLIYWNVKREYKQLKP